ncbi:FecR family protein [Polaribacter sp. HaHaR_3_91]|jgi:ferric-dicitrate binding protein FerR (iron transport regulator)|uniref:FecR family protein n=1 Tax=Polaribacter sp. HaHaR_3_91 TaxID=2745561 RepID=UPI001C4F3894|nr:FecR family protein [Polaribacter sp. HaHaR_3_91]QXP63359.1 FecR family protein [Polaribacter sp. HaHaR_3_91]
MISNLITKYLNNEASEKEVELIFKWIEASNANKKEFIALKKTWVLTSVSANTEKKDWQEVQKKIRSTKTFTYKKWLKYAAAIIIFISIGKYYYHTSSVNNNLIEENSIVLQTEDKDNSIKIKYDHENIINSSGQVIAEHNKDEIIYKKTSTTSPTLYHTLNIPLGKTFKVKLSDGTTVHLNSGTTFKYPKQFSTAGNRLVYLEGEAFFEVEKDATRPFIVNIADVDVKVLGTKFNISAYSNTTNYSCVLVEGSVDVSNENYNSLLIPNQKASWNNENIPFKIEEVNTDLYTSWVYGEYILDASHFSEISKKLERAFNVRIINNNKLLESQEFSGTINFKTSTIENILDLLKFDTYFEYTIKDNQIIISSN